MTLRHMKIFVAVCDCGGMTKAAAKLYMVQPSVSVAIAELEKHYGVKLFDRIAKRLYLTDAGHRLLQYARHITAVFEEAEDAVRDCHIGKLHVGTSVTIGNCLLSGYLKQFSAIWPQVDVQVTIDNSEHIEQGILENALDIGLIEGIPHSAYLHCDTIRDDNLMVICSPSHPFGKRESISISELRDQRFIMREKGSGSREILESLLSLCSVAITPTWESISTLAIIRAVADGFGIAVLPELLVADALQKGDVVCVPINDMPLNRKFSLIHHQNKYLTAAVKDFIRICLA